VRGVFRAPFAPPQPRNCTLSLATPEWTESPQIFGIRVFSLTPFLIRCLPEGAFLGPGAKLLLPIELKGDMLC
jgi:hypothetical protein